MTSREIVAVDAVHAVELEGPHAFPVAEPARTVDERLTRSHPAVALARALTLAQDRAEWLGRELRRQVAAEGVRGIVGDSYAIALDGRPVRVGEYPRVLAEQERRERELAAGLAERIARLGLDADVAARAQVNDRAQWTAEVLRRFAVELGLDDPDSVEVLAAAERAILATVESWNGRG